MPQSMGRVCAGAGHRVCHVDISGEHPRAKRCPACRELWEKERPKQWRAERKKESDVLGQVVDLLTPNVEAFAQEAVAELLDAMKALALEAKSEQVRFRAAAYLMDIERARQAVAPPDPTGSHAEYMAQQNATLAKLDEILERQRELPRDERDDDDKPAADAGANGAPGPITGHGTPAGGQ